MRVPTSQRSGLVQLLAVLFLIAPLADAGPLTDFLDRARARSATPSPTKAVTPSPTEVKTTPAPTPAPTQEPTQVLTLAPTRKPLFKPKATPVPELQDDDEEDPWDEENADIVNEPNDDDEEKAGHNDSWDDDDEELWDDFTWSPTPIAPTTDAAEDSEMVTAELPADDDDEEDDWDEDEYSWSDDDDEEEANDDGWDDDDEGLWDDFTYPPTPVALTTEVVKDSVVALDTATPDPTEPTIGLTVMPADDDFEAEGEDLEAGDDDDEGLWDDFTYPPTPVAPTTEVMEDSVVALDTATPIPTEPTIGLTVMPADDDFQAEGEDLEAGDDDLEDDEDFEDMMEDDPEEAEEEELEVVNSVMENDDDLEEDDGVVTPVAEAVDVTPAEKGEAATIDDDEETNDDDVEAEPEEEKKGATADDDEEEEKEEHGDDDEERDDDEEDDDQEADMEIMGQEDDAVDSGMVEPAVEEMEEEGHNGDEDGIPQIEADDVKVTPAPTTARSPAPTNGVPIVDPDGVGLGVPPGAVAEGGLPGSSGGGLGQGGGNLPGVPNLGGIGNGPVADMITGGAKDGAEASPMTGEEGGVTNPTSGVNPTDTTSGGGKTTTTNITPPTAPANKKEDKILPINDALPADGTLNEETVLHSGASLAHASSVLVVLATAIMVAMPLFAF